MNHHGSQLPCLKCEELFNRYPNFNDELKTWFLALRVEHPEAHISCAGRGKVDQQMAFVNMTSRARWTESAHNYNAAIDIFEQRNGVYTLDLGWFEEVVKPQLYPKLCWYGDPHAPYRELPHVELANWKQLAHDQMIQLVE